MGTKHAGIPEPALRTPPLSGAYCPDPAYAAGRALVLVGPQVFLTPLWVFTASLAGQAAAPPPVILPPPGPEGAIPFVDDTATAYAMPTHPEEAEGSTAFVDDV